MRGIVLVGERANARPRAGVNPRELDPKFLLSMRAYGAGSARGILQKLVGLRWDGGMNLLMPAWNNTPWDHDRAQQVADSCKDYLETEFTTIVLLGRRVARAFGFENLDFLQADWPYAILPHPNGLNRWWSDTARKTATRKFAAELVERSYK